MNQVTEEKKDSLTKTFAIVGFVVLTLFIVWLAVRIVSVIPSAFSSLASIAESVYNYSNKQELVVATPKAVVNAGESFTITWTEMRGEGTYSFSYKCTDGVSVDVKNTQGEIVSLACDTPLELNNATSLELLVASEKSRFTDISYTIAFTKGEDKSTSTKAVTIVNASIPASANLADNGTDKTPVAVKPTPTKTTPTKTPTYVAGKPTVIKKIVYTVPVSDPNGKTDLQVTFLGVGVIEGRTFIPKSLLSTDDSGALQFEVKNIGTKTSGDWSYEAELPSDITYTSENQIALKPNERAVITLGFEGITKGGVETVGVEVSTKNDVAKANDQFVKNIVIVK